MLLITQKRNSYSNALLLLRVTPPLFTGADPK